MSETKNVVIKQNNGTDYDKLHPETVDSKVNLTDDNVSVWGNTLKDALPKIDSRLKIQEENEWSVGDIKCSTKDSLGNKWLKCDGGTFSVEQYPKLANYCEVKGFPFGNKKIEKVFEVPGRTFENVNQENNFNSYAGYPNIQHSYINKMGEYYVRFKQEDSSNGEGILTIYYSNDNINWNTGNSINLGQSFLTGSRDWIRGIGFVNNYYFISLKRENNEAKFLHSVTIDFLTYSTVDVEEVIKEENWGASDYTNSRKWDGKIFYNNGYYSFLYGVYFFNQHYPHVFSVFCDDINFSGKVYHYEVFYVRDNFDFTNIESFVFQGKRYSVYSLSYGNVKNSYIMWDTNDGKKGTVHDEIISKLYHGCAQTSDWLYLYFKDKTYNKFYGCLINSSSGKNMTLDDITMYDLPTMIRPNGDCFVGLMKIGEVKYKSSSSPSMANATEYTNTLSGVNPTSSTQEEDGYVNFENESGIFCYTNDSWGNNPVYKISYGRVLPIKLNQSSSVTPINTFIKALD